MTTTKHKDGFKVEITTRTGQTFTRNFKTRQAAEAYSNMMRTWK